MKKTFVLFLLVLSLLVFGAACSKKEKTETDATNGNSTQNDDALVPESKNINGMFGYFFAPGPNDPQPFDTVVEAFSRENPDFTIERSEGNTTGDFSQDYISLAGLIAANSAPDVFSTCMSAIGGYYTDLFMPLQEYVDIDPEFNTDEYDTQTFKLTSFNDKIYFFPLSYTTQILAWNKDLFEDVGLDKEKPPTTWSEYKEYCERLVKISTTGALEKIGVYPPHFRWDHWHVASTGKHYVDKTGLECYWNTPEFVELLEFARSLSDTFGGMKMIEDGWWWYLMGNVGMGDISADGISSLGGANFEAGIARLPMPDDATEYYSAADCDSYIAIPRTAKNPKGAWKFIKYTMTDGRIEDELKNYLDHPDTYKSGYIVHKPTREKLYTLLEDIITAEELDLIKQRDKLIEECNIVYYRSVVHNEVHPYFEEQLKKMLMGEIGSQDLMIHMQEYTDKLIDEFIKQKEEEGWVFEEGKDGIPPSENENN